MSEIENYKGKLIPVDMNGLSLDEKIQEILGTKELGKFSSSWLEELNEVKYEQYYWNDKNKTLYEIVKKEYDPSGFMKLTENPDGTIDFITSYYNGGTYLAEMIYYGFEDNKQ